MLTLDRPTLDFVNLAKGMGVEGARVEDLDGFTRQLQWAMGQKGPYLIEVVM
jgi:acetolactate synthase-1/2/3 large subunit